MYDYISGTLELKKPTEVVIDVQGIGYLLRISLSTYKGLPDTGSKVKLISYLHVREDALILFGFSGDKERDLFLSLLSISGIGPKLAQTTLSGLTPDELILAIQTGDEQTLNSISGVGKKTAQRLVVELQDKFGKLDLNDKISVATHALKLNSIEQETILALLSLGYNKVSASKAIDKAQKTRKIKTVEELIKTALQVI